MSLTIRIPILFFPATFLCWINMPDVDIYVRPIRIHRMYPVERDANQSPRRLNTLSWAGFDEMAEWFIRLIARQRTTVFVGLF